jgi:hypothetical protein
MTRPCRAVLLLFTLVCAAALACRNTPKNIRFMKGQSMEIDCDLIQQHSSLAIDVDSSTQPGRAFVRFVNRTPMPLWFPAQQEPVFRPDERTKILTIWFGYFEEVHARFSGDYMIPRMRLVPPGENLTFEITLRPLVQRLVEQHLSPLMRARVAAEEIAESRTRGEQPLQEYIRLSCVIQSPMTARGQSK